MSYKNNLPDLNHPINEKQYNRLYKYCFNAGKYLLEKYNYSTNQLVKFYETKRGIPDLIFIIYEVKNDEGNIIGEKRESLNIINKIINDLEEEGFLNEERSIISKIRMYTQNRKGKNFILSKLIHDGFEPKQVERILEDEIDDELELYEDNMKKQAYSITRKSKFLKSYSWDRKKMIITSLANRGYEISEIYNLIDSEEFEHYFE